MGILDEITGKEKQVCSMPFEAKKCVAVYRVVFIVHLDPPGPDHRVKHANQERNCKQLTDW